MDGCRWSRRAISIVTDLTERFCIVLRMDIEQKLPNKPSFGFVVGLAFIVILIFFGLALAFLQVDQGHLGFRHHSAHPTSQLTMPQISGYLESAA
jgi:hypothetical protein